MGLLDLSSYKVTNNVSALDATVQDSAYDAIQAVVNALTNANIDPAAAIAISKLADPMAGKVIGSSGGSATAVYPPGYELDYAEFTSDKTSTATSAATASLVVSGNSVTYDGSPIWVEFFAPYGINVSGSLLNIELYDGASAIDTLCSIGTSGVTDGPLYGRRKLTPSAAAHTYSAKAWNSGSGTGTVKAGAGGSGVLIPGYLRVVKA